MTKTLLLAGSAGLLGLGVLGILSVPALGHEWWVFAAVACLLTAAIVVGKRQAAKIPTTDPPSLSCRLLKLSKKSLIGLLSLWVGLILWSKWAPGSAAPPAKADPAMIRVVTWNIHCGQDHGPPWKQFDWPVRKFALQAAIDRVQPDVLCVQETTGDQVAFLEKALPEHRHVGIGRDGGPGEHCAIYFKASRFEEIAGGTFWLEEPIDQPGGDSLLDLKRICTWVRVRDRETGRTLRIYNTHLYLTEGARLPAVRTLLAQLAQGDPSDAVLLTADFNATPSAASRRLFAEAGFLDTAELAGRRADAKTLHLYGIPLRSIDGILVKPGWQVHEHRVLSIKPGTTWPSDHFGVLADVTIDAADAHP
jgi:endonuclease/exonuclease/phosphatase family metal-dependent hydrolase